MYVSASRCYCVSLSIDTSTRVIRRVSRQDVSMAESRSNTRMLVTIREGAFDMRGEREGVAEIKDEK